jgi:hypothetical protein
MGDSESACAREGNLAPRVTVTAYGGCCLNRLSRIKRIAQNALRSNCLEIWAITSLGMGSRVWPLAWAGAMPASSGQIRCALPSRERFRKRLTAFSLILQTIAVWVCPTFFVTSFLKRVTVGDHTLVKVLSAIIGRYVFVIATDGLILAGG